MRILLRRQQPLAAAIILADEAELAMLRRRSKKLTFTANDLVHNWLRGERRRIPRSLITSILPSVSSRRNARSLLLSRLPSCPIVWAMERTSFPRSKKWSIYSRTASSIPRTSPILCIGMQREWPSAVASVRKIQQRVLWQASKDSKMVHVLHNAPH